MKGWSALVSVVRRAEVQEAGVGLAGEALLDRAGDPGLADPRLAREEHHAALVLLPGLPPPPEQQVDILLAPDERRRRPLPPCSASNRLSTALSRSTRHARTGSAKPFASTAPRSAYSKRPPIRRCVLCRDHDRVRFGQRLQPGGEVRRLADDRLLLRGARADADRRRRPTRWRCRRGREAARLVAQSADRIDKRQPGSDRPLGIVLVRLRVAEVDEHAVAHVLGDEAVEAGHGLGDAAVIRSDHLAQVLGIEPRRQRRRADEIAEHHSELPPLGGGDRSRRRVLGGSCHLA